MQLAKNIPIVRDGTFFGTLPVTPNIPFPAGPRIDSLFHRARLHISLLAKKARRWQRVRKADDKDDASKVIAWCWKAGSLGYSEPTAVRLVGPDLLPLFVLPGSERPKPFYASKTKANPVTRTSCVPLTIDLVLDRWIAETDGAGVEGDLVSVPDIDQRREAFDVVKLLDGWEDSMYLACVV
jgi:hypothetical protein